MAVLAVGFGWIAAVHPPFQRGINRVRLFRPEEKMVGTSAFPVIAGVTDK